MITHVVTWKLKAEDVSTREAATAAIKDALEALVGEIEGLRSLVVRGNVAYPARNWDVVLLSEFDSLEALDAYQLHPSHVAAAAIVSEHVTERASIDVEV